MEEMNVGRIKIIISTIPNMKGCNIELPVGVTTAFLSIETLETIVEKINKKIWNE